MGNCHINEKETIMKITSIARATFVCGITVFVLIVVMASVGGNPRPAVFPNAHGYTAAMYWFERVESVQDLFFALGKAGTAEGMRIRQAMDAVNTIDFAFMIAYSAFFASLYLLFSLRVKHKDARISFNNIWMIAGIVLSILMLFGDIFENIQLLKLTKFSNEAEVDINVIAHLMFFTRLKWFAIFFASIGFSILCAISAWHNRWWYLLSLVYVASGVIGFMSFFVPGYAAWLELSANVMGAGWLISTLHAGYVALRKNAKL